MMVSAVSPMRLVVWLFEPMSFYLHKIGDRGEDAGQLCAVSGRVVSVAVIASFAETV